MQFSRQIKSFVRTVCRRGWQCAFSATFRLIYAHIESRLHDKEFLARRIYDFPLYLNINDQGISRTLLLFRERELDHKWLLEKVLNTNACVLDIGANIGYYVVMEAQLVGPTGRIIAFEPSTSNYRLLKLNIKLNDLEHRVITHNEAVSSEEGNRTFFLSHMSNLNTFHKDPGRHYDSTTVKAASIVNVLNTYPEISLIRMDVEGHEVEILGAALPVLRRLERDVTLIFELHVGKYVGTNFSQILGEMWDIGYRCTYLSSSDSNGRRYFERRGYSPVLTISSDEYQRSIFESVKLRDLEPVINGGGGARTVVLQRDRHK